MPLRYVTGDPTLTGAQTLAIGHNARGQIEMNPVTVALRQRNPVAFSTYEQRCRKEQIQAGDYFIWRDSQPRLMFMAVRESAPGTTRLRHVQSVALSVARDFRLEGIKSLAIAPLFSSDNDQLAWREIKKVLEQWFSSSTLTVVVYDQVQQGIQADEAWSVPD